MSHLLHKTQTRTVKEQAKEIPLEINVQELVKLVQINKKGQISNEDACFHLWSLAAAGSNQRDEMLDAFLTPTLIRILASPNYTQGAKYNAVGCLQMLCTEEEGCRQVWEAKVMSKSRNGAKIVANVMIGDHDRSKVCAAAVLYEMSTYTDMQGDVLAVLPTMLRLLEVEDPEWAGMRKAHAYVATAIRNLVLLNSQKTEIGGLLATLNARRTYWKACPPRNQMLATGAIPVLASLLRKGPKEAATSAVACLRELCTMPAAIQLMIKCKGVENLITVLNHGVEEQKALAAGCMFEMSADDDAKDVMVEHGALIPLVKCLSWGVQATSQIAVRRKTTAKTGSKKKMASGASTARLDPPLPLSVDIAVCNATGTLHHLSFIDDVKVSIRECGAIPLLVKLLHAHNRATQENATGILWNLGLEPSNRQFLMAGNCPAHLVAPLHPSWLTPAKASATQYAGSSDIISKPHSAPAQTTLDRDAETYSFVRRGGGAMHPPRTPEEDAIRNKTPPTRTVWGGMQRRQKPPVTLPKVAYNKRGAE